MSPEQIIDIVSKELGVPVNKILERTRLRHITFARHVAAYFLYTATSMSLKEVGRFLGGRDHSTILHSISMVKRAIECDLSERERTTLNAITSQIPVERLRGVIRGTCNSKQEIMIQTNGNQEWITLRANPSSLEQARINYHLPVILSLVNDEVTTIDRAHPTTKTEERL